MALTPDMDAMKKPIQIAHLVTPIQLYGKEKWLLALLKYIDRNMFPTMVICIETANDYPLANELSKLDIECITVNIPRPFSRKGVRDISNIVQGKDIDILHSHDSKANVFALLAKFDTGIKILSTPHGWSNEPDAKLYFYEFVDKMSLCFFDHVAPLSNNLINSLRLVPKRRVTQIKNFIDIEDLQFVREFDPLLFSFVGRLTKLKRIEDAIKAISYVNNPRVRLQIIGEGKMENELRAMVSRLGLSERISFLGFRFDVLNHIAKSAALILPSLTEGISRVAMEAMALGRPVIGTDIPGNREIINDNVTGFLVRTKNPRAIARAIDHIADNVHLIHSVGLAARNYILENHSAVTAAHEYGNLYRRISAIS